MGVCLGEGRCFNSRKKTQYSNSLQWWIQRGFMGFHLNPLFGLAMYTRSVFYADDYDMWKPPLPAKLI